MATYLALLRGINVGGRNKIKMASLRKCFEDAGFTNVTTYIQSGNVIFTSDEKSAKHLEEKIEKLLKKEYSADIPVVVITKSQLQGVIEDAPKGFGTKKEDYKYDAIFLKNISAKQVIDVIETREGVDKAYKGKNAVYFSRLVKELTKSKLNKIIQSPIYKSITIRNWNTTSKLFEMMNSAPYSGNGK